MKFELEEYHHGIADEELIADLKRAALELNKNSVTRDEQDDRGNFHSTTYIRHFGSWRKALEKFVVYINNEKILHPKMQ